MLIICVSAESSSPHALTTSPAAITKPLPKATTSEEIPGETEEDGILRREYVLVDEGPAVEFHKKVDGKRFSPSILIKFAHSNFLQRSTQPVDDPLLNNADRFYLLQNQLLHQRSRHASHPNRPFLLVSLLHQIPMYRLFQVRLQVLGPAIARIR